ncbi:Gamma-butyrobetaine dioxygenase [Colletotrichum spinosum]|uniref:Gamma-butyrobetaine dioxygenase n=1 Tax=Colletotrichum spinosum TaxID=1347390 RepID=A0A4R8Q8D5_9PEZI|nr:Gamma-butyrobetaine dioxygenase [Colletotrichum spinosum]
MATRSFRSALGVSRVGEVSRTGLRQSYLTRFAGLHTTSRKTQEAAAPSPETTAAAEPTSPKPSINELQRSLRSFVKSAKSLNAALTRELEKMTAVYRIRKKGLLEVQSPRPGFESYRHHVPASYLRDRCPCPQCLSPSSGNKSFSTAEIPATINFKHIKVQKDGSVHIRWYNDVPRAAAARHVSVFPARGPQSIDKVASERNIEYQTIPLALWSGLPEQPWTKASLSPLRISYAAFMAGGRDFHQGALELSQTGLLFLTGVPQTETAVADIALKFGAIKETFYGRTWDVISKPEAENVAYTSSYLGLHSDMLYLESPPRIQLLHCLENSCTGGESMFSDASTAAAQLRSDNRGAFRTLTEKPVTYHYSANGFYYRQRRPVIETFFENRQQRTSVWWSPPFQAPFPRPQGLEQRKLWGQWLKSARHFKSILEADENVHHHRLEPGECVLFDNRRVMHGRREFDAGSGRRWLKGTYVADEDFVSTLKRIRIEGGAEEYLDKYDQDRGDQRQRQTKTSKTNAAATPA